MLINKTDKNQIVTYNGRSRELKPGESIDIRDFEIANKDVPAIEKHIISKHPGLYDQKMTIGDSKVEAKYNAQIEILEKRIIHLGTKIDELKKSEKVAQDLHAASAGEVETARQEVESMKKEVNKYKFEKEELEAENQKLREQVTKQKVKI